ncbi:unnamed protein product, partial [Heterosigma akashiwo]
TLETALLAWFCSTFILSITCLFYLWKIQRKLTSTKLGNKQGSLPTVWKALKCGCQMCFVILHVVLGILDYPFSVFCSFLAV